MFIEVNFDTFVDTFRAFDRLSTKDTDGNFTWNGLAILFDYLEQLESDTGEKIELDVIDLCLKYSEYTRAELKKKFDITNDFPFDDDFDSDDLRDLIKEGSCELIGYDEDDLDAFIIVMDN